MQTESEYNDTMAAHHNSTRTKHTVINQTQELKHLISYKMYPAQTKDSSLWTPLRAIELLTNNF